MKSQSVLKKDIQPHSVWRSLILHFLPGVLVLLFVLLLAPIVKNLSLPIRFVAITSIFLVLIPVELGILFYEGKKRNGKLSLKGIVVYQEKIPLWQYFLWVPLLVVWSSALALLLAPLGDFLSKTVFSWLPEWFISSDNSNASKVILIVMVTAYGIANVSAAIVEELYFRGYLMPRLSRLKGWSPLVNAVLFALQHFLTPWQVPFIILGMIPQAYLVFKKRNLLLGILAHSILNLLSSILLVLTVFG
ncbi:MAG: CPBP family intramembrane metalloprotease [Anaerolineaceae bacterium]|nr:CPBP family intramembrane metalloprotease [Anaerolineaceae bacterium]